MLENFALLALISSSIAHNRQTLFTICCSLVIRSDLSANLKVNYATRGTGGAMDASARQ